MKRIWVPMLLAVALGIGAMGNQTLALVAPPIPAGIKPSDQPIQADAGGISSANLPNTVNCFDHYTFGSVQVHLNPSIASTVSGAPITFTGTIQNDNPYPIDSGSFRCCI